MTEELQEPCHSRNTLTQLTKSTAPASAWPPTAKILDGKYCYVTTIYPNMFKSKANHLAAGSLRELLLDAAAIVQFIETALLVTIKDLVASDPGAADYTRSSASARTPVNVETCKP